MLPGKSFTPFWIVFISFGIVCVWLVTASWTGLMKTRSNMYKLQPQCNHVNGNLLFYLCKYFNISRRYSIEDDLYCLIFVFFFFMIFSRCVLPNVNVQLNTLSPYVMSVYIGLCVCIYGEQIIVLFKMVGSYWILLSLLSPVRWSLKW